MEGSKRKRKRKNTRSKQSTSTIFEGGKDLKNQSCLSKKSKSKICLVQNIHTENIDHFKKKRHKTVRGKAKKKVKTGNVEESRSLDRPTSSSTSCNAGKANLSRDKLGETKLQGSSGFTNNTLFKHTSESKGIISNQNKKGTKRTSSFKERLQNKLESGRFRWINEKLYTSSSKCATELFENDPELFQVYHQGFSSQVHKWPVNPVDVMIKWIKKRSSKLVIVDMGCGEAKIAQSVPNKVFSFDLVAANNFVTVSDIAKVPLQNKSVHVVIYCLSLMGTNLTDFLKEAKRILKDGGTMKVAEVASRFDDIKNFEEAVCSFGFSLINKDTTNKLFVLFEFMKSCDNCGPPVFSISLKPCLYKKR